MARRDEPPQPEAAQQPEYERLEAARRHRSNTIPGAFKRCFGRGPRGGLPGAPEAEEDPKAALDSVLAEYELDESRTAVYRRLADTIDIDVLQRSCTRGFGELRRALAELVAPHLRASSGS
jgi:hypothetical protein